MREKSERETREREKRESEREREREGDQRERDTGERERRRDEKTRERKERISQKSQLSVTRTKKKVVIASRRWRHAEQDRDAGAGRTALRKGCETRGDTTESLARVLGCGSRCDDVTQGSE